MGSYVVEGKERRRRVRFIWGWRESESSAIREGMFCVSQILLRGGSGRLCLFMFGEWESVVEEKWVLF